MDHITLVAARPNRRGGPFADEPLGQPRVFELRPSDSQDFSGDAVRRCPDNMLGVTQHAREAFAPRRRYTAISAGER